MGYQAVLFCPDEKLARVVSQVFDEVDFVVDPVNDPFATVKKLMAQHYDAVVVDCENQQNSSLLFKSAHNSPFNQNSLAIALVEGQAGIAQAYRMGANLVLTKPINVEQAKGTLRVARGLLRKSADVAPAASTMTRGVPAKEEATPFAPAVESKAYDAPAVAPLTHNEAPAFAAPIPTVSTPAAPLPAMNAWGETQLPSAAMPSAQTESPVTRARTAQAETSFSQSMTGDRVAKAELPKPAEAPAPVLAVAGREAGAAAPAPAKEAVKAVEMKPAKNEAALDTPPDIKKVEPAGCEEGVSSKRSVSDGLSFAAFREQDAAGEGGNKKILIVAAVLLGLAVAGYFGLSTFGGSHSGATSHPVTAAPQSQPMGPQSDLAPMSSPTPVASPASKANRQTSSSPALNKSESQNGRASSSASSAGASPERTALSLEPAEKGSEREPIRVRPDVKAGKTQAQDEATLEPPSPVAVELPDSSNLSGLMNSEANAAKPTLAQIKISQGVSQGLLIKSVQPKYPAEALASHAQGAVLIEATIDKEGIVVHPKVLSGNNVLAKAALEAVRQWRYKPYYLNGEPVEIQTQIRINFKGN
jgi:TonB family protein